MSAADHERHYGVEFQPAVGDLAEFWTDLQTEKGPSAGSVVAVDPHADTVTIRHSDHPGEVFNRPLVRVNYHRIREDGRPYWQLK